MFIATPVYTVILHFFFAKQLKYKHITNIQVFTPNYLL